MDNVQKINHEILFGSVESVVRALNDSGESPLTYCLNGATFLESCIAAGRLDLLHIARDAGATASREVFYCIDDEDCDALRMLYALWGACIFNNNHCDAFELTPIMYAVDRGRTRAFECLISCGGNLDGMMFSNAANGINIKPEKLDRYRIEDVKR